MPRPTMKTKPLADCTFPIWVMFLGELLGALVLKVRYEELVSDIDRQGFMIHFVLSQATVSKMMQLGRLM